MPQPQHEDGNQRSPSTREPAEPGVAASVGTAISSADRTIVVAAGKRASLQGADFKKAVLEHLIHTCAKDCATPRRSTSTTRFAHTVRDRLVHRWLATQRTYLENGRQARLLPVLGVPDRPQPGPLPDEPGPVRDRRGARRRARLRPRRRCSSARATPGSATAAWAGWRRASWTRWPRWSCPAIGYGIRYEFGIFEQEHRRRPPGRARRRVAAVRQPVGDRRATSTRMTGALLRPRRARTGRATGGRASRWVDAQDGDRRAVRHAHRRLPAPTP